MSYSFSVRGSTKESVLKILTEKLDEVVASQPMHAADRQQAYAATEAFLEVVPPEAGKDYSVSVNGSVGWTGSDDARVITGAGVGISVSLIASA